MLTRRMPALLPAITMLLASSWCVAHDLYLVADIPGAQAKVCARIGEEFPASSNGVTADRVARFRFAGGAETRELKGKEEPKQFCAVRPEGTGIAEMLVSPRFIRLEAKDFNSYTSGEGLTAVTRARETAGATEAEGRELYSRYAKLLVGALGESATRPLGHALEIVPEKDPMSLKPGEPLPVHVLFLGKPLADAMVSAVYAGAKLEGHTYPVATRTDSEGRAVLPLDRPGLWYARLIHMVPAQGDPEVDWRSYFATLTFEVPRPAGATQPGSSRKGTGEL